MDKDIAIIREYKILMYDHIIVDESLLNHGIYETIIPRLHSVEQSIEDMVSRWEYMLAESNMVEGLTGLVGNTIENLKKCRLVKVTLTIQE